ncbi:MAG: glycosyltransferase family 39 protein [Labilithrix sp.]|nr:glycosyltransferase family 39 protein [Labilithrix sp.]
MLRRLLDLALGPIRDLGTPERIVLFGVSVLHVAAIGWGLPASDCWDVDGISPRDFLPGLVKTFTPGDHFTYPPLHLALLTLLTLPITIATLVKAPSLAPPDLIATFLAVPVMTSFALAARLVNFLMSLGIVLAVGRMSSAIFGRRARVWAMAVSGVEVAGTYYAHTTNLDIPALFWSSLALLALIFALEADDPKKLRRVAILAACGIASKDQAYAIFAVSVPIVLSLWIARRHRSGGEVRPLVRQSILFAVTGVGLVLLFDGALFNPTGFAARVRFLAGPASQDFAQYSRDWSGRLSTFQDAVAFLPHHYPTFVAPVLVAGAIFAVARAKGNARIAALVPLLGALSFTLAFNCVARRVEERFMLPQMQLMAVYAGAVGVVLERWAASARLLHRAGAAALRVYAVICVLGGVRLSTCVVLTMASDPRYDAERFVREHVRPEDVVEVYGSNVYLPRFPPTATVHRIDERPPAKRNPMPGLIEKQDRLGTIEARKPRWVIVSMGYAWRYLQESHGPEDGRVLPAIQLATLADADARDHFRSLFHQRAGYFIAHVSHYDGTKLLPARPMHASLAADVFIFERR